MREPSDETQGRRPRIGSLFSGYGGLDLAVEEVFDGETVWPGTRSGLWARMAEAIDVLQPEWVVAENVRGLLSAARRARPRKETRPMDATPPPQPPRPQQPRTAPFAVWSPIRGVWETSQLDLYGLLAPYSAIWSTSGMTRAGSAYPLPTSAHPTPAFASSSSRAALFRTPLASDAARGGESLDRVRARRGTIALSHQVIDLTLNGPAGPGRHRESELVWPLIDQLFDAGDATPWQSDDGNT